MALFWRRAFRTAAVVIWSAAAVAGCNGSTAPSVQAFPADTRAALDNAITQWLAAFKAPGVVAGIWIPGQGSYVVARGVSDLTTGTPMQTNEHFRIGSITKTFTVTALLQLAGEGKLGLDDPVSKYVSYIPNGQNITLRMLANMTSGLFSYTEDDAFVTAIFTDPARVWTPRQLIDVGIAHSPDFPPGTGFHYSNTNTVLLGVIIEQVTGKPIQDVFAEKIFAPLGLHDTSWPTSSALPAPYAHGITEQTLDGTQADATNRNPSWAYTAGQLISNLDDLKIWIESYATGSLITPAMQQQRLTWVTFPPNTNQKKYGLGIGYYNGWLGHTGELPGYNSGAFYLPQQRATIVILVNSDIPAGADNPVPALWRAFAQILTPNNVPG